MFIYPRGKSLLQKREVEAAHPAFAQKAETLNRAVRCVRDLGSNTCAPKDCTHHHLVDYGGFDEHQAGAQQAPGPVHVGCSSG